MKEWKKTQNSFLLYLSLPEQEEIDHCLNIDLSQTMRMQLHYGLQEILSSCPLTTNIERIEDNAEFVSVIFVTSGTRGDRLLFIALWPQIRKKGRKFIIYFCYIYTSETR